MTIPLAENSQLPSGSIWPVASFTSLYLVAALVLALSRGNLEFVLYIVVTLLLIVAVWVVHRCVTLSGATLWGLSIWGLAHMAGGLLHVPADWPIDAGSRVLYSLWLIPDRLKYDQVVHAYGFGMATWVCWQGLRAAVWRRSGESVGPSFGLLVLAATAGMGLGALNELVEFMATLLVPETNVGGYINTGWDLAANFIGSIVAAILIWCFGRLPAKPGA